MIERRSPTSIVVAVVEFMLELGRYDRIRDTLKHPCASAEDLPLSMTRMQVCKAPYPCWCCSATADICSSMFTGRLGLRLDNGQIMQLRYVLSSSEAP